MKILVMWMKTFYYKYGRKSNWRVLTIIKLFHVLYLQNIIHIKEIESTEAKIIESLVDHSTSSHQIVCPVCLRLPAKIEEGQVTCSCGLKFPLPGNISLQDFEATLLTCSELHSMSCNATPSYQVHTSNENSLQFVSRCESCQMFSIILEAQPWTENPLV